jgi:osomolarity two-component system response regulator SSK1
MDIQMPIMDGLEATKEIRRIEKLCGFAGPPTPISDLDQEASSELALALPNHSSVVIVALTASSMPSDRIAAASAGCNDFLTKPVKLDWLNNKIMEWGWMKALRMWADLHPGRRESIAKDLAAQAEDVVPNLHIPEGRLTWRDTLHRSSLSRDSAAIRSV